MRRLTVTVDDALLEVALAEVRAGRAPSVSAWVADAMRAKAQARAELIADLEALNRRDPPSADVLDVIARSTCSTHQVAAPLDLDERARIEDHCWPAAEKPRKPGLPGTASPLLSHHRRACHDIEDASGRSSIDAIRPVS